MKIILIILSYSIFLFGANYSNNIVNVTVSDDSVVSNSNIGYNGSASTGSSDSKNINIEESFNKIDINIPANLTIKISSSRAINLETDSNALDKIEFRVKNSTLFIRTNGNISSSHGLDISISNPSLKSLRVDGAIDAVVKGLHTNRLELLINGASDISVLSGNIGRLYIKANGSYDINLEESMVQNATIEASGAGDIKVAVSKYLDVNLKGNVDVRYSGSPRIKKHISGNADLSQN
jgi:hypothetical protein